MGLPLTIKQAIALNPVLQMEQAVSLTLTILLNNNNNANANTLETFKK